jgi:lysyl-tRNA synthetase class 1
VKLQWKPDFGARWAALGVDFEMYGKDHSTNTPIYDAICEILGAAPEHFTYELFLDENGQKISKSKGNGISIDEWLSYASTEACQLFHVPEAQDGQAALFRRDPQGGGRVSPAAARLSRPGRGAAAGEPGLPHPRRRRARKLGHGGELRDAAEPRLRRPRRGQGRAVGLHPPLRARRQPETHPDLDAAAGLRGALLQRFREATKVFRAPTDQERAAMEELVACLGDADKALDVIARKNAQEGKDMALPEVDWHDDEFLQSIVFAVGKTHGFEPLRDWFSALYEVLMGASQGPRFGGFIALYGIEETRR